MIHQYRLGGYNIVLDTCSGSVHAVDEVAYDMIGMFCDHDRREVLDAVTGKYAGRTDITPADIAECYDQVAQLKEDGTLFAPDSFEPMAGQLKEKTAGVVKALCLHVAHTCNLNCSYCFASQGKYHGERALMSYETGKQALDFLIRNSGSRHNLEVDFFGGEPLMNFDVVKQIVEYARGLEKQYNKNFRFTVTTNGMLLDDDIMDYINKEMSNVVLSIDGRKDVNDSLRRTLDGSSCYDHIVPKFKELVARRGGKDYYVRGTFTKKNLDFASDVLHLNDLGFNEISVEPAVLEDKYTFALTEEDLPVIFKEYEKLADELVERQKQGKGFNFFHFMIDLEQGPCAIKRLRGCGCGNEYVAITPDGDIYPCHQFVGNEQWKMGSVHTGEFNNDMKQTFAKATVVHKKDCQNCWARFYCSGGCNANSANFEGDILKSHKLSCEMEKKRVECAIYIKAKLA